MSKSFKSKYFPDSAIDVFCIGKALCDITKYPKSNFPTRIQILFDDKEMQFVFEQLVVTHLVPMLSCDEFNELIEDVHFLKQDD